MLHVDHHNPIRRQPTSSLLFIPETIQNLSRCVRTGSVPFYRPHEPKPFRLPFACTNRAACSQLDAVVPGGPPVAGRTPPPGFCTHIRHFRPQPGKPSFSRQLHVHCRRIPLGYVGAGGAASPMLNDMIGCPPDVPFRALPLCRHISRRNFWP